MALTLLALLATTAFAAPSPMDLPSPELTRQQLRDEFNAHFYPERLSGAAPARDAHGFACLTPLVAKLKANWSLFSTAEQREFTSRLAPWAEDLTQPFPSRPAADAPPDDATAPPASGLCFDVGTVESITDPEGRFGVVWESGTIDEDTAQDFLTALTRGYETQIDEMEWREPVGMSRYQMLVYVADDDSSAGAYTTIQYCSGVGYTPYVVAYSGSFYGGTWYRDMAVHEFNHASQYAYNDERGAYNSNAPFWYFEATATWMQEYNYDDNWWSTYITGYTNAPYVGMEVENQSDYTEFYHMYGMAIWNFYLDKYVGGPEYVRGLWEDAASHDDANLTMEEMIDNSGEDWREQYMGFIATNTVMDYKERAYFDSVDTEDSVDELPAEGDSSSRKAPQGLGQNYIVFEKGAAGDDGELLLTFDGEDDTEWMVLAVQTDGSSVDSITEMEVDDETGEGELSVEFPGDDELYLVISPFEYASVRNNTGKEYAWTAEWVANEDEPASDHDTADDGSDDPPEEDDDGTADPGEEGDGAFNTDDEPKNGVCGCATTQPAGSGLAMLGVIGALALRRRRVTRAS